MKTEDAIKKVEALKKSLAQMKDHTIYTPEYKKWNRDGEVALENIFGTKTRHIRDFRNVEFGAEVPPDDYNYDWQEAFNYGSMEMLSLLDSFIEEINEYGIETAEQNISTDLGAIQNIKLITDRFHVVARQLRDRYSDRETLKIKDEYDVQDLFHSLLKLFFEDVREEEWTPSYAGSASRVDFLLKTEQIVVEIKKTREGLKSRKVGEELLFDSMRYQAHPNCNQLICFVYDPEGIIGNPRGIENDLTQELNGFPISVYISP